MGPRSRTPTRNKEQEKTFAINTSTADMLSNGRRATARLSFHAGTCSWRPVIVSGVARLPGGLDPGLGKVYLAPNCASATSPYPGLVPAEVISTSDKSSGRMARCCKVHRHFS